MKKSPIKNLPMKKLILAGAGHAHIGLLRRLSTERLVNNTLMNADISLITEQPETIYSGMLPGWMAGHYQLDDISINVKSLCTQAGVRFIQQHLLKVEATAGTVTSIDDEHFNSESNSNSEYDCYHDCDCECVYNYDVLSLNTGADTDMSWLSAAAINEKSKPATITAVRPLSDFTERWQQIMAEAKHADHYRLAIIGGGAAATEIVMAAQVALQRINPNHQAYLICGEHLLSGFNQRFKQRAIKQLKRHDIKIIQTRAKSYSDNLLITTQDSLPMNAVIAATGVVGAAWTACTDLDTVDKGFIAVNATQQSTSHANVFAVGDVATRIDKEVAHSGVHAVNGGAVVADNLLAYLMGSSLLEESVESKSSTSKPLFNKHFINKHLKKYQPRPRTLYLLSCGDKYAIASWGKVSLQGHWVWYLKRRIDKSFVNS